MVSLSASSFNRMTTESLGDLGERIRHLARVPNLMVACDYDGTLAPLVDDPMAAAANRDSVTALRSLADLARTNVCVVSGRALRDLAALSRLPEEVRLVGSHGSEFDVGFSSQLSEDQKDLRRAVTEATHAVGRQFGALVEEKPAGVTIHFRGMDAQSQQEARAAVDAGPGAIDGVFVNYGRDIIEMAVLETNKGWALDKIRHQVGATAVLFMGDDVTDENGFETLAGPDVGVKVGPGETAAGYRVADTDTVAHVLALLAELRAEWQAGAGLIPIQDHSILSDLRTAAIVSPSARITWMCAPRIDSAAIFADLLGGESAGHFSVSPVDGSEPVDQRYVKGTKVLETTFNTFKLTDYLDASSGRTRRLAGRSDLIRVLEGSGSAKITFAPRLDFGRVPTQLEVRPGGVMVIGTADLLVLRSEEVTWDIVSDGIHQSAVGTVDLDLGRVVLEMRSGTGTLRPDARTELDRREDTLRYWSNWSSRLQLPPEHRELVASSATALKSLCHGPTGAIVAAATTSLPEHLGGVRNWDYRYCWLRDGALTASALARLGSHGEGMAFLDWVLGILETRSDPERLAPLYNVTGRHLPPEAEIADLPGYGGSRPVRVGNAADGQVQLDVFGPIVDLVHVMLMRGEALSSEHWRLVEAMVLAVSRRWREPDHGIWEIRKPQRHHVYSKTMCWVTVDRAIAIADQFLDREPEAWVELRAEIADDVLTNGWNDSRNSFTAAYDADDLDASVLALGLWGLIDPTDERFVSTVAQIEAELRNGKTVYRYLEDDGLPGREGGFNLMTSWLIDSMVLVGRRDDAENLFAGLRELVGATGLMAEEYDPENDRALGNFPQAYSHLGLINNVLNLYS